MDLNKFVLKCLGLGSGLALISGLFYLGSLLPKGSESDQRQGDGPGLALLETPEAAGNPSADASPPSEGQTQAEGPSPAISFSDPSSGGKLEKGIEASLEASAPPAKNLQKEHRLKKGDSLYLALSGFGIGDQEIDAITKAIKPIYDLRRIRPGQTIRVSLEEGSDRIDRLVYEIDLLNRLKVERSESTFSVVKEQIPMDRELVHRSGLITDSLYASGERAGIPVDVIMRLADIFAWDLDFGNDIHPGDRFALIFEVYKKNGETLRSGRVLAAQIVNRGKTYRAYYFDPPEGNGDYYEENGRSLRKAFLKSPLRYRYISSGYATRRLHPILKVNRPHLGIDFAARRGTPVRAAADGLVSFMGWKGGLGKTVIIRHPNGYKTLYGHLSSFWPGLKKGKRVKQEDFIGKVGSTGLSTGPHLHYTMIKNGKAINPKAVDRLRGEPLPEKWQLLFSEQVEVMNQLLSPLRDDLPENEST